MLLCSKLKLQGFKIQTEYQEPLVEIYTANKVKRLPQVINMLMIFLFVSIRTWVKLPVSFAWDFIPKQTAKIATASFIAKFEVSFEL